MTYRGNGDRRFNDWHYTLPKDWWYIDLDGVEACPRCREPLLLYEITRNPEKATTILARLSRASGVPAVLMLVPEAGEVFTDDTEVQWRVIGTGVSQSGTLGQWQLQIAELRDGHDADNHPGAATRSSWSTSADGHG